MFCLLMHFFERADSGDIGGGGNPVGPGPKVEGVPGLDDVGGLLLLLLFGID